MEGLFVTFCNLSYTASWLILVILVVRLIFRNAPRGFFCILWGLVALRLLLPLSIESAFSLVPSAEPLPRDIIYTATPTIRSGITEFDNMINPILSESLSPAPAASANPTQIWSFLLSWIWVIGMGIMLLYACVSWLLLKRRVFDATRLEKNIKQSDRIHFPFVLGFFRPVIYLPYNMSQEDMTYVLAHEKAHIARRDHWWKPIGFLILTIHWFNPLIWVAYVLLCRDIEAACDEKVVQKMDKDWLRAYSMALLNCSTHRRSITACPLAFGEVGVKKRIKSVMNYKKPAFWIVIAAVIVGILLAVCFMTNPQKDKPQMGEAAAELRSGTTYVTWQCLYMNPLSSSAAIGGDSGCQYIVGEDSFTTVYRRNTISFGPDGEILKAESYPQNTITVPKWQWQDFPYTPEEWADLYMPSGIFEIKIHDLYDEIRYQMLSSDEFLLWVDGELWLVALSSDTNGRSYLWSIFSLIPESAMGSAVWELAPAVSSRSPVFAFRFEMDDAEITAYCNGDNLVDFGGTNETSQTMTISGDGCLYWAPYLDDGRYVGESRIHISINGEGVGAYEGTIYISRGEKTKFGYVYTAKIVGTGLHMSQHPEHEGALITFTGSAPQTNPALEALKSALTQIGIGFSATIPEQRDFMNTDAMVLQMLNSEDSIKIYEYESEALAIAAVDGIFPGGCMISIWSEDGAQTVTNISWVSYPHWYRSGNAVVLYVGENQTILELLETALGAPLRELAA